MEKAASNLSELYNNEHAIWNEITTFRKNIPTFPRFEGPACDA